MRMRFLPVVLMATAVLPVAGEPIDYDFKDPKGVNMVSFHLDSLLEPFGGFAYGVEGSVTFDPEQPQATSGSFTVPAKNIVTPHPKMTETLHGPDWLDVANHPTVSFEFDRVAKVSSGAAQNTWVLTTEGRFTVNGVTQPLQVDLEVKRLPDAAPKRGGAEVGDLLVVRTAFTIKRADFGIQPHAALEKVAPKIDVQVAVTGYGI